MKKTIIKIKKEKNYTAIDNKILQNQNLSWKAKGLLCYLMSLPDDWQIYLNELEQHSTDGRDSTRKAMEELIQNNYVIRERNRTKDGKFAGYIYTVTEKPSTKKTVTEKPKTEKPKTEKPKTENLQLLNTNNTNNLLKQNTNNTNDINTDLNNNLLDNINTNNKESVGAQKEKKQPTPKNKYLDFIFLSDDEHKKLIEKYGEKIINDYIEQQNFYIGANGKNYKSNYYAILQWINKDIKKGNLIIKEKQKTEKKESNASQQIIMSDNEKELIKNIYKKQINQQQKG